MKNIDVKGIRTTGKLYCKTGKINGYRDAFKKGYGASRKEKTWNGKIHTCCRSKVAWRHKATCKRLEGNEKFQALTD